MKVYHSSRLRTALGIVVFAAFAAGAGVTAVEWPWIGWSLVVLFALAALGAVANLAFGGPTLTVGRKGFEVSDLFRTRRIRWDEIEPPRLGRLQNADVIAIHYRPGAHGRTLSRALTGMDLAIGRNYQEPLQDLCRTMNEYRSRYLAVHPLSRLPEASDLAPHTA
jgi:hypothetical protein